MFNGPFNQMPFNRSITIDVYGSFTIDHTGEFSLLGNVIASPAFKVDHSLDMTFEGLRDAVGAFVLDHASEMDFEGTRDKFGRFEVVGRLEMLFSAAKYHIDQIEFHGEFKQGDRIIIDANNLKMTLNGQNALHMMEGDFFDLNTGPNELTYTDDQTGRTVLIRLTYRDKFV